MFHDSSEGFSQAKVFPRCYFTAVRGGDVSQLGLWSFHGRRFHGLPCSGLGVQEDIADRWFEFDGCSME